MQFRELKVELGLYHLLLATLQYYQSKPLFYRFPSHHLKRMFDVFLRTMHWQFQQPMPSVMRLNQEVEYETKVLHLEFLPTPIHL